MQEILHWTRSVFFFHSMSFCRILSEAINVFVVHPQRWKRSWGNTVSMQPKQQKWSLLLVFLNCLLEHAMLKAGGPLQPKQLPKSEPLPAKKKGSRYGIKLRDNGTWWTLFSTPLLGKEFSESGTTLFAGPNDWFPYLAPPNFGMCVGESLWGRQAENSPFAPKKLSLKDWKIPNGG